MRQWSEREEDNKKVRGEKWRNRDKETENYRDSMASHIPEEKA